MADTFQIEIITPGKVLFSGDIDNVIVPGKNGEFQVLPEHTPFMTALTVGSVTVSKGGKRTHFSVSGGFCEVKQTKTVILAQTAESSDKIDQDRAAKAIERAQKRINAVGDDSIDIDRAGLALLRAMNRLNVTKLK